VGAVFAYATDAEWARYLPVPQPYTARDAEVFVASQLLLDHAQHATWAIECQGVLIGGVNIRFFGNHHIGELGYGLAPAHWGQGFITEAAAAVVQAAFDTYPQLHRVRASADPRNTGSLRVMEKLGMQREAHLRQNRLHRGEWVDEAWCGLLRSEWNTRR
jgi:RimJ/RimL family protein N-acetyltransferase